MSNTSVAVSIQVRSEPRRALLRFTAPTGRVYSTQTDAAGRATLSLPAGVYKLDTARGGKTKRTTVAVGGKAATVSIAGDAPDLPPYAARARALSTAYRDTQADVDVLERRYAAKFDRADLIRLQSWRDLHKQWRGMAAELEDPKSFPPRMHARALEAVERMWSLYRTAKESLEQVLRKHNGGGKVKVIPPSPQQPQRSPAPQQRKPIPGNTIAGEFDTMPQSAAATPLEFHLGIHKGTAIATCPQLGQTYTVPLRDVAQKLRDRGALAPLTQADLYQLDQVSGVWVGDDFEAAGDIIEIGGTVARKLKKAVKKTVSVAKKAVKSGLGKAIIATASAATGGAAGGAMLALSTAAKVAKKAKKGDPKAKKAQALGKRAAAKPLPKPKAKAKPIAKQSHPLVAAKKSAVAKKSSAPAAKKKSAPAKKSAAAPKKKSAAVTAKRAAPKAAPKAAVAAPKKKPAAPLKKLTAKLAVRAGVQPKAVHAVAVATKTKAAAKKGDPTAKAAVAAVKSVEKAKEKPLQPTSFQEKPAAAATPAPSSSTSPASYGGGGGGAPSASVFDDEPSMFDDGQGDVVPDESAPGGWDDEDEEQSDDEGGEEDEEQSDDEDEPADEDEEEASDEDEEPAEDEEEASDEDE